MFKILHGKKLEQVAEAFKAHGLDFSAESESGFSGLTGLIAAAVETGRNESQAEISALSARVLELEEQAKAVAVDTLKAERETPEIAPQVGAPVDHLAIYKAMKPGKEKAEYFAKHIDKKQGE